MSHEYEFQNYARMSGIVHRIRRNETGKGVPVTNLRLEGRNGKSKVFLDVVCWAEVADSISTLNDGATVAVEGRITLGRGYTKQDGTEVAPQLQITANTVTEKMTAQGDMSLPSGPSSDDDDIPFHPTALRGFYI